MWERVFKMPEEITAIHTLGIRHNFSKRGIGKKESYPVNTKISDVIGDAVFEDYGRLIFPVDERYYNGKTLGELQLKLYNNIDPDKTVEIADFLKEHAEAGDTVFYDIYTDEEKASDPAKEDTGVLVFGR